MRKFLPVLLLFVSLFSVIFLFPDKVHAADPITIDQAPVAPDGSWVLDPEVTFIGKNAARSGDLLNFTLQNYGWVCISKSASGQCDNNGNPLTAVWLKTVTYIVVPLLFIVILITAIVVIVTRGRSLTIMRFLPRFVAVILLIFFSFAIIQFFYQFTDVIQGFFLRPPNSAASCPPTCISNKNLLYIQWKYEDFAGLRLKGDVNSESAFMTLLLTKLTALTYFVMVGILYLRRIILWLFIIVSPIFPILLLFYPVRNTGKIWIGEFFRWLLYAPLFAIFLQGLVFLWQPGVTGRINNIPLVFENTVDKGKEIYPTAVNILLGAPGEKVDLTNSINIKETFAEYVVSLLMLWGVIILPWILLQIFLDYAQNIGVGDSAVMKNMINMINRQGPPGAPAPHSPSSGGASISIPFTKKFNMPNPPSAPAGIAMEIPVSVAQSRFSGAVSMPSAQVKAQVLTLTNMSLPSMRDIARYDTSLISRDSSAQKEAVTIRDNLVKIGNPASITSTSEKERYVEIREKLVKESNTGNSLATSILTAANTASKRSSIATTSQIKSMLTQIANPQAASAAGATSVINREKISKMNESLVQAKKQGNTLATAILSVNDKTSSVDIEKLQEKIRIAKEKGEPVATQIASAMDKKDILPVANRVQTVSREDFQAVKDMWKENYKNLEVPEGMAGTRTEWVKDDIAKIDNIVSLLDSKDEEKISKGMEEVSSILPFLLVGGFSQTEIVSYLKAKQEAAKEVVASLDQDEEDKVSVPVKKTAVATGHLSTSISDDSDGSDIDSASSISNLSSASTGIGIQQISNEILSLVDIKLPSIRDIARYEALSLSKDKSKTSEIEKAHEVLRNIASPENITDIAEKQRYEKVKEKLIDESGKGNLIAEAILSASAGTNTATDSVTPTSTKTLLSQIANPSMVAKDSDKKRFTALHDQLENASKGGNSLAASLLKVKETVTKEQIENLTTQLNEEKIKGNALASSVLSNIVIPVSLPSTNRIQNVSKEDYSAVKDLWRENYQGLEVPKELGATRVEWLKQDVEKIGNVVNMLSSTNQVQISKGMEEVSSILPFLLVGGFSQAEIISYLNAKQEAASEVLTVITQEEDSKISISSKKSVTDQQTMSVSRENVISSQVAPQQSIVSNVASKIVIPQASAEILKLANLQLPTMVDVAEYESMSLSKEKSKITEIEKIHETLRNIANPERITNTTERERFTNLKEKILEESQKGNLIAESVLTASQGTTNPQIAALRQGFEKTVFAQIANPSLVTTPVDREHFIQIHESLVKESKENNNQLAKSILSINEATPPSDLVKIKEQLHADQKESSIALTILSTLNTETQKLNTKHILQQIANPSSITSITDKARLSDLHDKLSTSSKQGNEIASAILSVKETSSVAEIAELSTRLTEAKEKGDLTAAAVLSNLVAPIHVPVVNRTQTVSKEDYQAVKDMWKENYKNLEVPEGMAGTRTEWVNDDISKIDNIISLMDSKDEEKISKGMEEVSSILPFLLVGGFSQAEIISYLNAKQEAASEVLTVITQEEDSKISISSKKSVTDQQTMAVSRENVISSQVAPQQSIVSNVASKIVIPQASAEILKLANLQLPNLRDIASFEMKSLTKDKTESERVEKIHQVLERLNNPQKLTSRQDQQQYEELRERLAEESLNGNVTADIILSAVSQLARTAGQIDATLSDVKKVLLQIVNSSSIADADDRDYYTRLHEYLETESKQKNNTVARSILSVNDKTKLADIQNIKEQLNTDQIAGSPVLPQLTNAVNDFSKAKQLRLVISQILSLENIKSQSDKQAYTNIRKTVDEANKKGDILASSLLSVTPKTSEVALTQLHKRLSDAGKKGDPTAKAILSKVSEPFTMSSSNRLQEVRPEEYKEAMDLWRKAYTQYLVPSGFTEDIKGRSEWINSDISDIEQTIGLLQSPDVEKRDEGIKKVSSILPFLLLGGFSYDEMNTYLKSKLDVARSALTQIQQEEEGKISVNVQNAAVVEHELSAELPHGSVEDDFEAPVNFVKKDIIIPQGANEILSLVDIKLPTIQDVARYDSESISRDKSKSIDIDKIHATLEKIINPTLIPVAEEREKYQKLQERLILESQKEDSLAASVLNAATLISQNNINTPTTNQIKNAFSQIIYPNSVDSSQDRKRLEELRNMLAKDAHNNNNQLAAQILSVNEKTTVPELEKIREQLIKGQKEGDRLASAVIWSVNKSIWGYLVTERNKSILLKIAHPETVSDLTDKEQFSKVHNALQIEAHDNNDKLAISILKVGESTSDLEISNITKDLKGPHVSAIMTDVNNLIYKNQSLSQVKKVLEQVANPALVLNTLEREKITKINDGLKKASSEGNQMARSILAVSSRTPDVEIESLQQQIEQGKSQREPLASEISMLTKRLTVTSLPSVNRIQAVSADDYTAVKNIWIDSYKTLDVSQSIVPNRSEWIRSDISKIDNAISGLSSGNKEQESKGMDSVSDILPFLLIGGFSQTEIIEYLKSKKEAGEETLTYLSQEEDNAAELTLRKYEKVNINAASEEISDEEETQK